MSSMAANPRPRITRLAPSPTGALHLGNARTFLLNWLMARSRGWAVLMRIEDLDGPRTKAGADRQALDDLAWLGLGFDGPAVYQSSRSDAYLDALGRLIDAGWAYPCTCSRKDVQLAAGAPHAGEGGPAYPGTCRGRYATAAEAEADAGRPPAWRVRVGDEPIEFVDGFAGPQRIDLSATCGDFVIYRNEGLAGYQLAVVVDDAAWGVDAIVRGDDLLDSAARQVHLRRLLGLAPEPEHWHLPLVVGPDGRRLAKRHGDTRLASYREAGTPPERVLGLLGHWSGLLADRGPATLDELLDGFDLGRLPPGQVVFTAEDDAFLRGG